MSEKFFAAVIVSIFALQIVFFWSLTQFAGTGSVLA